MKSIVDFIDNYKLLRILTDRGIFIRFYFLCSVLWFFPLLGWIVDPIAKVCFIWGALLIGYDIIGKRIVLRTSYWYWIALMLIMYCVTILLNSQSNLYMGIKHLIYNGIAILVFFSQNGHIKREKANENKLLKWINSTIIIIVFFASCISLAMYCLHIGIRIELNGMTFRQGFLENRLFGIYTSPNTGALFSIICIGAICINSFLNRGSLIKWKKSYVLNAVIQLIYFSLTLSNGGFLSAATFIILTICLFVSMKMVKTKKILVTVFLSLILTVISIVGLSLAINGIRTIMSSVPGLISNLETAVEEDVTGEENEKTSKETITFERIETGDDLSNGRLSIWTGSLKIWIQAPIFGIADAKVDKDNIEDFAYSLDNLNASEMERMTLVDGNLHNSYIQILTDSGLVGLICFLAFIILVVKKYLKYLFVEDIENGSYKIISMLVCILGTIGVNGMVETHLLFNRQDPYGLTFWFYLGSGLILINNAMNEARFKDYACRNQREKFLFICDTPFQIFNCVNFVQNNQMGGKGKSDIIIVHQFQNSKKISERLKKQKIFCHVYDVNPLKKEKGVKSKFRTFIRIMTPKRTISSCLNESCDKIKTRYRFFFLSFQTSLALSFHLANPYVDIYLIEDGLGSYVGNIEDDFTSVLYKIMNKYFLDDKLSLRPQAVYLNSPQLCYSKISTKFAKLADPKSDSGNLKKIMDIFNYSLDNESSQSHFIYLTQPLEETKGYIRNSECIVQKTLHEELNKDSLEVRVHPRQKDYRTEKLKISDNSQMWELECLFKICDSQILISAYSTTLFMPKLLNNKEPILIFVYKLLFEDTGSKEWLEREKFIANFAATYADPLRVFIPDNMEEFRNILKKLRC